MKINVMKKWVAALESGEYKQGSGCLQEDGKYCCLGVLCELAKKEGVIKDYSGGAGCLPNNVKEWADMSSVDGTLYRGLSSVESLDRLNDGTTDKLRVIKTKKGNISVRPKRKMSFKNIAKVIKEYHKEL